MANINDFKTAATVLQEVDISDIFTSLAMGIAEAQAKLDDNSIAQLTLLAQQKVGDKSLIELGFMPAFYGFTEANISASINLKMAMKESLDVNASINASYSKANNLDDNQTKFINTNKFKNGYSNYTNSKSVTMKASEKNSLKIEEELVQINQEEGCVKMIESFEDKVLQNERFNEVVTEIHSEQSILNNSRTLNINRVNGYVCICKPHVVSVNYGVLKITSYAAGDRAIDLDATDTNDGDFDLVENGADSFKDSLEAALAENTGIVYGFSKDGFYWEKDTSGWKATELALYFKHDNEKDANNKNLRLGDRVIFGEDLRSRDEGGTVKMNDNSLLAIFKKLNTVLGTSNETITIIGETDSTGGDKYNHSLGERRANAFRALISSLGCRAESIGETKSKQAGDGVKNVLNRKASIKLNADYIVFEGGSIQLNATPGKTAASKNKFIVLEAASYFATGNKRISYKGNSIDLTVENSLTEIQSSLEAQSQDYLFEIRNETLYMLHKEALLKFSVFTKDSKKVNIEKVESRDEEYNIKEDSILINEVFESENSGSTSDTTKNSNNTFAIGGSVDVRYARSFEMSMEGNASMSAKLVSLPAPKAFEDYLKATYNIQ